MDCKLCGVEKPIEDFYLIDGYKPFSKCKLCIKIEKKSKFATKLKGWDAIDEILKAKVIKQLQDRRVKVKDIAKEHNLVYPTLLYWIRTGKIVF